MKFSVYCYGVAAFALLAAAPAPAAESLVPHVVYGDGVRAAVRAGVATAVVSELIDSPPLLAQPASQTFVDDAFAALGPMTIDAEVRRKLGRFRDALRPGRGAFDRNAVSAEFSTLVLALVHTLPPPRDRALLLGNVLQQTEYNARVLREETADRDLRRAAAKLDVADGLFAGFGPARVELANLPPERWNDEQSAAHRLVAAVLGPVAGVPFPPVPGIWTIVVRSHDAGSGPGKRAAPHLSLDVVWFDGRHRTFGALPNRTFAFAQDAPSLACVRDREPATGNGHATPLVPPAGTSYDAIAASFERSCDAFDARTTPYRVSEASDDRFVAAMLAAAGIDPTSVRGDAR